MQAGNRRKRFPADKKEADSRITRRYFPGGHDMFLSKKVRKTLFFSIIPAINGTGDSLNKKIRPFYPNISTKLS
jgi:hypothetical protein